MRIIDRYIFGEFLKALIYCIVAFTLLYIIGDFFTYIDEMLRNRVGVKTMLVYYATFVPLIFVQISPITVILATIYTLSAFKRSNEITAMRVSGVSLWRIIMPILFTGALMSIAVFVINDRLVPKFTPISAEIREDEIKEIGEEENPVVENIAIFSTDNRIIYARTFDTQKNELGDIIIHQNDADQNLIMRLSAEKGYWENGKWVFSNGTSYKLDRAGYIVGTPVSFRKMLMNIKEKPKDFTRKRWQPEFMNFRQLRTYIDNFAAKDSSTIKKFLVDLYYKTSFPAMCLIVIFVAAPCAFMAQRGGLLIGLGISILLGFVFYGILAIIIALGKAGFIPPFLSAWLTNIIFLIAGIYLMSKCG